MTELFDLDVGLCRGRHGTFWCFTNDRVVSEALRRYGEWAESEIHRLSSFVDVGATVVDGGAHLGSHSIAFVKMVGPSGRVVAIEAERTFFTVLAANAVLNGARNLQCVNGVLGEVTRARVGASVAAPGNFGATAVSEAGSDRGDPVLQVAIDDLDLGGVALLKLDIEGMETEALRGALGTIRHAHPVVYYEQASDRHFADAWQLLAAEGYRQFWHRAPAFNRRNFNGAEDNIFGAAADQNVLALPDGDSRLECCSDLPEITSPTYAPADPDVVDWALPEGAYSWASGGDGAGIDDAAADRVMLAQENARLRAALAAMTSDRARAQEIMEAQHAELQRLRGGGE